MFIEESLNEFAKRGRPRKNAKKKAPRLGGIDTTDDWDTVDDEDMEDMDDIDIDTSDMENAEIISVDDESYDDELFKALKNELKVPEFNRRTVVFRLKGDLGQTLEGIPMAKMGESSFLFKLDNGTMKKIALKDVILENQNSKGRARFINEDYNDEDLDKLGISVNQSDMDREYYERDEDEDDEDEEDLRVFPDEFSDKNLGYVRDYINYNKKNKENNLDNDDYDEDEDTDFSGPFFDKSDELNIDMPF